MSTQPDGDIVVGAYQYVNDDLLTFRYLSNGALDTSLDGDGVRANQLDNSTQTLDFIETFDGSYAAVGQSWTSSPYRTVVSRIGSVNVPDYLDNGTADWDTGGTSTALFGACLRAVSGGATASWTTNAACTQNDGLHWNDIPSATDKIAFAASPEPDPADASAHIRFGVRSTSSQPPGAYFAPISFEVLAPNA
jgi:hypothetical protein